MIRQLRQPGGSPEELRLEAEAALRDLCLTLAARDVDEATLTRIAIVARSLQAHVEQWSRRPDRISSVG